MLLAALTLTLTLQEPFKPENKPQNLKLLFEKLHAAISAGDDKAALALSNPLFPDEAALKKGLRDDVAPTAIPAILEWLAKHVPTDEAARAQLFKADPQNTEVRVYPATTEELAADEKAAMEFPGGAKTFAKAYLRPGTVYYQVKLVKPGAKSGASFSLFFWSGEKWVMLGALWRVLRE